MDDRRKILLVDDEKKFTVMLKLNLEAVGNYQVQIENDSLRAVQTAVEFNPELILLDIIMPNKEGPDIAIDVKGNDRLKNTPIVFLTATVTKEEAGEQNGMIGGHPFVAKPSNLKELIEAIERNIIPPSRRF